jgi:hypothetical protein
MPSIISSAKTSCFILTVVNIQYSLS